MCSGSFGSLRTGPAINPLLRSLYMARPQTKTWKAAVGNRQSTFLPQWFSSGTADNFCITFISAMKSHLHPWQARTQGDPSNALVGTGASGCRVKGCVGPLVVSLAKRTHLFWHRPQGWICACEFLARKGVFLHLSLHFGCFENLKNQIGKLCILQLSYNYHFIISSRLDISQVIFFYCHVCPSLAFGSQRQLGGENRRKIHRSAISIHFFIVISFFDVFWSIPPSWSILVVSMFHSSSRSWSSPTLSHFLVR